MVVKRKNNTASVDVQRREVVEHPQPLADEDVMAAYFRGFVAGAQRSEHESARFESLKDLIHRIAAEKARRIHGLLYEDALSYAYAAALNYLRRVTPENEVHFRKKAAVAIRNGITDGVRETPTRMIIGSPNHLRKRDRKAVKWGWQFDSDGKGESRDRHIPAREEVRGEIDRDMLESVEKLKPRERVILSMLSTGLNHREVGERLGLTESRVCQIVKAVRERCGKRLLATLSA